MGLTECTPVVRFQHYMAVLAYAKSQTLPKTELKGEERGDTRSLKIAGPHFVPMLNWVEDLCKPHRFAALFFEIEQANHQKTVAVSRRRWKKLCVKIRHETGRAGDRKYAAEHLRSPTGIRT